MCGVVGGHLVKGECAEHRHVPDGLLAAQEHKRRTTTSQVLLWFAVSRWRHAWAGGMHLADAGAPPMGRRVREARSWGTEPKPGRRVLPLPVRCPFAHAQQSGE